MFKGVDVSRYQGIIDWDKFLEDEHSDFAIIRAGFVRTTLTHRLCGMWQNVKGLVYLMGYTGSAMR